MREPAKQLLRALILVSALTPQTLVAQSGAAGPTPRVPQQPAADADAPVIVHTDLVTLNVTVTDADGRHVTGLDGSAFTVYDNKVSQEIIFFSDADEPVSVAVVFDTSGSMSEGKLARAREALARFVETSHPQDEFFLVGFGSKAELLLQSTRDADAVRNKLTYVEPRGETALFDAVYLAAGRVTRGAHRRRAILIISDGEDNHSRYSLGEVRRFLREAAAVVYAVRIYVGPARTSNGRETLKGLAEVSGGRAFFPASAAEMGEAFERIALELRSQYSIGYKPSNLAGGGEWHRLRGKVTPPAGTPRLTARSRDGYFALAGTRTHPARASASRQD